MKLLAIEGENFGVLDGRPLNFTGGLQVVYGPNEAGKSTLLRLVRETLFGFPSRAHGLDWNAGGIAAQARLQLRDGRILKFRRQMRRQDIISGQWEDNRDPVDEATLAQILSGASAQLFNNLFAFSLRELFEGEESLKNAGLGESLFTGGWGGLEKFRRVQGALATERESLFKLRGKKQVLLNLQGDINTCEKEYRNALVPPQEYDRTQTELKKRIAAADELKRDLQELQRHEQRLEQQLKVLPHYRRRESLRAQRSQLSLPAELTGDRAKELGQARDRLFEVERDINEVQRESAGQQVDADDELTAAQQHLLDHTAAIGSLGQQLSQMEALERELPNLIRKRDDLQASLQTDLERIGSDWTLEDVESLKIGLKQREQLQALLKLQTELDKEKAACAARRPDLERDLKSVRQQLEKLPAHRSVESLDDLLDRSETWKEQEREQQGVDSRVAAQRKETDRLRGQLERKLRSAGATCDNAPEDWTQLAVPLTEALEDWRGQWQTAQAAVEQWTARVEKLHDELCEWRQDLAEFDRLHPQLDRQHLLNLRERRNLGWDLLRRRYIDGDATAEAELQEWLAAGQYEAVADEFANLLAEADRLADLQYSQAELLARRDQLTSRVERQEQQLADDQENLLIKQKAYDALRQSWLDLWSPLGIVPAAPASMLEWRQHFERYIEATEEQQRTEDLCEELLQKLAPFELELRKAFPDAPSTSAALKAARTEFDTAQRTIADRNRLDEELAALTERWEQLENELTQLSLREGQLEADRRKLLKELNFPEELSLDAAERTLDSLLELQRGLEEVRRLEHQELETRTRLKEFDTAVKALLPAEDSPWSADSATVTLSMLSTELEATKNAELIRAQRQAQASESARKLADLQRMQEHWTQQLKEVRIAAGLAADVDLTSTLTQFQDREQLDRAIRECDIPLQELGADASQLGDLNEGELGSQLEQVRRDRTEKERRYQEEAEQIGAIRQKLQDWADSSHVDRLANRLEHLRSEFAQAVDRWAPLALAEAMMQRALSRFEKHHQPRLLADVGDWLSRLTGGRYRQLQSSLEEPGVIRVVDHAGTRRKPEELSTGTREQLFLAIRLAYVTDYARKHDPLPLVLDDVLVNFDDNRALETLRALQGLGETHQILLLTCHRRTVELGRSLSLDDVVELQPESLQQLASEGARGTGKRKRSSRVTTEEKQPALFPPSNGRDEEITG